MNIKIIFFTIIIGIFAIESCTFEKVEPAKLPIVDTAVSYSITIVPIVNAQCISCHCAGGSGNGDFTTYIGIKAKVDNGSLYNRIVTLKDMPMIGSGYTLTDAERTKFSSWINQGGKNN